MFGGPLTGRGVTMMSGAELALYNTDIISAFCAHGDPYSEWFITCDLADCRTSDDVARGYDALAETLAQRGITPISEKAFGRLSGKPLLARCRSTAYGKRGFSEERIPFSYVQGAPSAGNSQYAGVQVCGIEAHDSSRVAITDILNSGACLGKLIESDAVRQVVLTGVNGQAVQDPVAPGAKVEIESLFNTLHSLLAGVNFSLRDVARTWFYMKDILTDYDLFNSVRRAVYRYHIPEFHLPASTGIQGQCANNRRISLDAVAIRSLQDEGPRLRVMKNPKQPEANKYGAFFSRGMEVVWPNYKILHISGTASIDEAGRTLHAENPERQIECTLDHIATLLNLHGASMSDIVHACAYFKNNDLAAAFDAILGRANGGTIPCLRLLGDICRRDLFFEMECVAVVQQRPNVTGACHNLL